MLFTIVLLNLNRTYWWLDVEEVTMKKDFNAGVEAFRQQLAKRGAKILVFIRKIGL